jgi:7-carboxy-7-deazaguanine synthase
MNPEGTSLPLMEDFYTIQGEGYNSGEAAYFIRLAGCDVGCVWCDVKDSWNAKNHPVVEVSEIVKNASRYPSKTVVITGGEPLLYSLDNLCSELRKLNFKTYLETSGAYPLSGKWDWITVSPKKFKAPLTELLSVANELKVIVYNKSDFEWAEKNRMHVNASCKLFLQPEYSVFGKISSSIVDYVKKNPQWKISLQTHKVLEIP